MTPGVSVGMAAGNGETAALSPALLLPLAGVPAFELKFRLGRETAGRVQAWAGQHLALDAHADPALDDAYRIGSLCFDTDRLDVFRQSPSFRRRKFRLRRYGDEPCIYLERKTRAGDRVRKRRSSIALAEVGLLQNGAADPAWSGCWFHRRVLARQLRPRCLIGYDRVAYVGTGPEGPMRLTLDRNIHCAQVQGHDFERNTPSVLLLKDEVILELKFRAALPLLFKRLIQEFELRPTPVSKYRLGMEAWGASKGQQAPLPLGGEGLG